MSMAPEGVHGAVGEHLVKECFLLPSIFSKESHDEISSGVGDVTVSVHHLECQYFGLYV